MSRPGGRRPERRGERGSTLIELLVAMVVLMVALALAHGLLVECLRVFASSSRDLLRPDRVLAVRQLRSDLAVAQGVGSEPFWNSEPLVFRGPDGWRRWRVDAGRLLREELEPGRPPAARPMLDGVVSFLWRTPGNGLVEVEILRSVPRGEGALRASTPVWRAVDQRLEQASVLVASRTARRR